MTKTRIRMFPVLFAIISLLVAACAERQVPITERSAEPPIGVLGNSVTPVHYQLELVIDPSQERFSGTATINVSLNEDRADLWLHGKNLNVTDVFVVDREDKRVSAIYAEKDDSGVALVSFERAIAKGPAILHFTYDAPFNTAENGAFGSFFTLLHALCTLPSEA